MYPMIARAIRLAGVLALLLLAGRPALAVVDVDLVWTATTGSGTTGGSFIEAAPGDILTAEIRVTPDAAGVCCAAISVRFDEDFQNELDIVSFAETQSDILVVPSPPLYAACQPVVGVPQTCLPALNNGIEANQESTLSQIGSLLTFEGLLEKPLSISSGFLRARIEFEVTGNVATDGADVVTGAFNIGVDAVGTSASDDVTAFVSFGSAGVDALPGPAPVPGLGVWAALLSGLSAAGAGVVLIRERMRRRFAAPARR